MPARIICMNPLFTLLLLALAGCPQAGQWPARSAGASDATTAYTSSTSSTSSTGETGTSGTDGESDSSTGALASTGGVSCMPSGCHNECSVCMADQGCAELHECVKCIGQHCGNGQQRVIDCRRDLETDTDSATFYGDWIACLIGTPISRNVCEQAHQKCDELAECLALSQCLWDCNLTGVGNSNCVGACERSHPEGIALYQAWWECLLFSPDLVLP